MFKMRGLRRKFFFVYIFTMSLLLFAFCTFTFITERYKDESRYISSGLETIKQMAKSSDYIFSTFENLVFQISVLPKINEIFLDGRYIKSRYYLLEMVNELKKYSYIQSISTSVYVYFRPEEVIFSTSEGLLFNIDEFYDKEAIMSNKIPVSKLSDVSARNVTGILFNNDVKNVISIRREISPLNGVSRGMIIYNIEADLFYREMANYGLPESEIFLVDRSGKIVCTSDKTLIGNKFSDLYNVNIAKDDEERNIVKINDEKQFMFKVASSRLNGWQYIAIVPYNVIEGKLYQTYLLVIRMFFTISFIALIAGFLLFNMTYLPLRKIFNMLDGYIFSHENNVQKRDEIMTVIDAIRGLINENSKTNIILNQYQKIAREKIYSDLIFGNFPDESEITEKLTQAEINYQYSSFCVAVVSIISKFSLEPEVTFYKLKPYISELLESEFVKNGFCPSGIFLENENIAFILNFDYDSNYQAFKACIIKLVNEVNCSLSSKTGNVLYFSLGSIVNKTEDIRISFYQARHNLTYMSVLDNEQIIFPDINDKKLPDYPIHIHKHIVNGIKSMNEEIITSAVDKFFDEYLKKGGYSLRNLQHFVIIMVSSVYSELLREGEYPSLIIDTLSYESIFNCHGLESLRNRIIEIMKEISLTMKKLRESNENDASYVKKALTFISENYMKDISLLDVSTYVGLNPRYLGSIFKEVTSKGIYEYIIKLRIDESKKLFKQESTSVKDISKSVGFNDVHCFIRLFKKHEGITPGEYRQLRR